MEPRTEPGGDEALHVHRFDQLYWVTEGALGVEHALDPHEAAQGSLVIIPAGVPHRVGPAGATPATYLLMNVPPSAGGSGWESIPVTLGA